MSLEYSFLLDYLSFANGKQDAQPDAAGGLDWPLILHIASRHGLIPALLPLFNHAHSLAPASAQTEWGNIFKQNLLHTLRLSEELGQVTEALAAQGIKTIPYKGPVLAQTLYGDVSLRQYNDLDLLTRPSDVPKASALLHQCGYSQEHHFTPAQERLFLQKDCEYSFYQPTRRIYLDLHWHFVPRYFALRLDMEGFWQRTVETTFEGQQMPFLGPEDTLLVSSINAAKDFWARLSATYDIAFMVNQTPQMDWAVLFARAIQSRAQRMLKLSLWLAKDLFGVALPAEVEFQLAGDGALPKLAGQVKELIFVKPATPLQVNSFLLPAKTLPNLRARAEFHWRLAAEPSPEDWQFVALPSRLAPLYYFTRPVRLLRKYLLAP